MIALIIVKNHPARRRKGKRARKEEPVEAITGRVLPFFLIRRVHASPF
jgi:hypothetical protein